MYYHVQVDRTVVCQCLAARPSADQLPINKLLSGPSSYVNEHSAENYLENNFIITPPTACMQGLVV
jgi:hypothetical protein